MEDGSWKIEHAKRFGVRWQTECNTAFGIGCVRTKAPSPLRSAGAVQNLPAVADLFLLSAFCFQASGQYSLDWSTIDGGGGASTGGVYSVTGTIGQPDAGQMSGGTYTLQGGFWSVVAVVPSPGAPTLTITLTPQLSPLTVSWPLSETPWQLQATTNLVTTGSLWTECSYQTNGATCCRIESPPAGKKFYRLRQP